MASEMPKKGPGYLMGHGVTTKTHEMRTVHNTAAFVLPHIKPTDRILDLGCGPGTITVGFAEFVPEGSVIGADLSDQVLEKARQTWANKKAQQSETTKVGSVEFVKGNMLQGLPFEDESFDVVYLSQVLVHLVSANDEHNTALKEIRRVLRTGGFVASSDSASQAYYPYTEELERLWAKPLRDVVGRTPYFGGAAVRKWMREAGFEARKVKIGGSANIQATKEDCAQYAESFAGRLAEGQPFRANFIKSGIPEQEVDEAIKYLKLWGESEDAYFGGLNTETMAWK